MAWGLRWLAAKEAETGHWEGEQKDPATEGDNDPFQILLVQPLSDKPKSKLAYVAMNVAYVLDLNIEEANKLTKQASKEGAVVLGTWTMKECSEFEHRLRKLDIMCRSIPAPVGSGVIAGDPTLIFTKKTEEEDWTTDEEEDEDFFVQEPRRVCVNSNPQQLSVLTQLGPQKTRHMSTYEAEAAICMNPAELMPSHHSPWKEVSAREKTSTIPSHHDHPQKQGSARKKTSTPSKWRKTWAEI